MKIMFGYLSLLAALACSSDLIRLYMIHNGVPTHPGEFAFAGIMGLGLYGISGTLLSEENQQD